MELYKFIEIVAPSITTGAFIVIGTYQCYFKKKFEKYGEIEGQLEKLPKLSQIEEAIANAKNSNEFEYWKKRGDSEKIISFANKIIEANRQCKDISYYAPKNLTYFCTSSMINNNHYSLTNFDKDVRSEDRLFLNLLDEIKIEYILYFKKYDNEFNEKYNIWRREIIELFEITISFVEKARDEIQDIGNINIELNKILQKRDDYYQEVESKMLCNESKYELFDAFRVINEKIEKAHLA